MRDLLGQGWSPLFGAMAISSATGIILDLFVSRYKGFALLAVIISGACRDLVTLFSLLIQSLLSQVCQAQ